VDTANALLLKESCEVLLPKIDALLEVLRRRAFEFKDTPQIGRTHGIHAEPTSFGMTFALWFAEMQRNKERLEKAKEIISVGKISGAVGAFAHLDPEVEERVCAKLGLNFAPISTQVIQRDRYAEYLCTLAIIASSLEKFALQVRIGSERKLEKRRRSSKPDKKARRRCRTNATRFCRSGFAEWRGRFALIRLSVWENVALWHERDISHSSAERIVLPDSSAALDYILAKTASLLDGLVVYPKIC
jgi:adenylosuccinate lyase